MLLKALAKAMELPVPVKRPVKRKAAGSDGNQGNLDQVAEGKQANAGDAPVQRRVRRPRAKKQPAARFVLSVDFLAIRAAAHAAAGTPGPPPIPVVDCIVASR